MYVQSHDYIIYYNFVDVINWPHESASMSYISTLLKSDNIHTCIYSYASNEWKIRQQINWTGRLGCKCFCQHGQNVHFNDTSNTVCHLIEVYFVHDHESACFKKIDGAIYVDMEMADKVACNALLVSSTSCCFLINELHPPCMWPSVNVGGATLWSEMRSERRSEQVCINIIN